MTHPWDEFSKSLAESVPRRESLRRLGAVFAGAALMPFSLALGAPKRAAPDPCKAFCNQCPKQKRSQCLAACQACSGNTSRLCGTCGSFACCSNSGLTCCSGVCVDVFEDFYNCGGCGIGCDEPGLYEEGACIDGTCQYKCVKGTLFCNGVCTPVSWDPNNCGACGRVCGGSTPYCNQGVCTGCPTGTALCGGECVDLLNDPDNCGECGNVCPESTPYCTNGVCRCPFAQVLCEGTCSDLGSDPNNCGACGNVCPESAPYCIQGVCHGNEGDCALGLISCDGVCIDPMNDPFNCGNCGVQCEPSQACITGYCHGGGGGW